MGTKGDLGPSRRPVPMPSYPHLLQEDSVVWARWLAAHAQELAGVWYDVRVGRAVEVPAELGPEIRLVARGVTRKRIDVVAWTGAEIWCVELKPFGNYVALGQALVYSRMLAAEYACPGPVVPMVICAAVDQDLVDDFQRFGVRVQEVGYGA